jgi:hypothetical protein
MMIARESKPGVPASYPYIARPTLARARLLVNDAPKARRLRRSEIIDKQTRSRSPAAMQSMDCSALAAQTFGAEPFPAGAA